MTDASATPPKLPPSGQAFWAVLTLSLFGIWVAFVTSPALSQLVLH